jgi:integrase
MGKNLTNSFVEGNTKQGRYYDSGSGLHLWIKNNSKKYWILRYTFEGRRKDLSLGIYPIVTLIEARKKALEAKINLSKGVDPHQLKKESNELLKKVNKTVLFSEFAEECIERKRGEWRNPKHYLQWKNTLRTYAYPVIGNLEIASINTDNLLKILSPIWSEKTETASRLRGRIEWVLSSATARGLRSGLNPAQWRGHLDTLLPKPKKLARTKHHPALNFLEIQKFIEILQSKNCISALALEFLILTGARTGEVIKAKKEEISENIWTIPGHRMKAGVTHKVPLSKRAIEIINIASYLSENSEYIFANKDKHISNMAMLALAKRVNPTITVHGFRSTFRDWISEMTDFPREVAEKCLAHTISNQVEAAYRRGDLFNKRITVMETWANYCLNETNIRPIVRVA